MRTIPDRMRTGEVCPAAFGSFIFINIGHNAVKGARGRAPPCLGCGDPRVMFVDISPPAGTRVVDAQVARGRRHGPEGEAGLGTWVCEQRVCESQAATNGVRATVVARRRS